MSSGLDDLAKGMAIFRQGMQDLGTKSALNNANDELEQINNIADEQLRSKEQKRLQQRLTFDLARNEMNPAHVAQVVGSFAPPEEITKFQAAGLDLQERRLKLEERQMNINTKLREQELWTQQMIAEGKLNELQDLPAKAQDEAFNIAGSVADMQGIAVMARQNPKLMGAIDGRLPWTSVFTPEREAFKTRVMDMMFKYKHAITGAASSDVEFKRIYDNMPKITDTDETFHAKVKDILDRSKTRVEGYMKTYKGYKTNVFANILEQINEGHAVYSGIAYKEQQDYSKRTLEENQTSLKKHISQTRKSNIIDMGD